MFRPEGVEGVVLEMLFRFRGPLNQNGAPFFR